MKHFYPFNEQKQQATAPWPWFRNISLPAFSQRVYKMTPRVIRVLLIALLSFYFFPNNLYSQNCPTSGNDVLAANENTYYPGTQATVNAGVTSISVGAVPYGYGTAPIAKGDMVMIIQIQGANFTTPSSATSSLYGMNVSGQGFGFTTTNLLAGYMEFATATNAVPITGGTLNISAGLTYSYAYAAYGTTGQYTYEVIRVPAHYNLQLIGNITTPVWNGAVGGVTVINVVNQLDFNSKTVSAAAAGFRGGGGLSLQGNSSLNKLDYYTLSTSNLNGSKGEGIAGTPRFTNMNNAVTDNVLEGYPGGSFARGAPGNAGGGATDSDPAGNDQNSGGAGGGNGGQGGSGGWGWYSLGATGGKGGFSFTTLSPAATYYSPSRLIMGGGGGAGTSNNGTGTPGGGPASGGASGGGIVVVNATSIINSGTIDVSGGSANNTVLNDGSGGAGAGGSILIYANSGNSGITALANGGVGGTNTPYPATQHGPGGGGAGGVIYSNSALNAGSAVSGGLAGKSRGVITNTPPDSSFGATAGAIGVLTTTYPSSQLPPNMQICQSTLLAISLLEFNATYINANDVLVSWATTQTSSAAYFSVERSTDAASFTGIGQVNATTGDALQIDYSFTDNLAGVDASIVYYRLRMVDQNGSITYSKVVPVKLSAVTNTGISIFPNPATSYTVLRMNADNQAEAIVRIIDNTGKQISTRTVSLNTGTNSIVLDQIGLLAKGIYFIQVIVNNNVYNQKLLKN